MKASMPAIPQASLTRTSPLRKSWQLRRVMATSTRPRTIKTGASFPTNRVSNYVELTLSSVLRRKVYTKTTRGCQAVRKLVAWATNKHDVNPEKCGMSSLTAGQNPSPSMNFINLSETFLGQEQMPLAVSASLERRMTSDSVRANSVFNTNHRLSSPASL